MRRSRACPAHYGYVDPTTRSVRTAQQAARFYDYLVYYDIYDGVLADEEEGERMAQTLSDKRVLILRNHGALVAPQSVAMAHLDVFQRDRACMYQLRASAGGGESTLIL